MARPSPHSRRTLGLELGGAKGSRTALAVLEYYPRERKTFLLDLHDSIGATEKTSSDETLIGLLEEVSPHASILAVNVPLTLPPCFDCTTRHCTARGGCSKPEVKWMREFARKASNQRSDPRIREFTAYTTRPVELWLRHAVLPTLESRARFDVDEAMGSNRAPLLARIRYIQRHLPEIRTVEALPKLTLARLAVKHSIPMRFLAQYRNLDQGVNARRELLERLSDPLGVFIYERDAKKISENLVAFDAFFCGLTALLVELGRDEPPPRGFPVKSGWIHAPALKDSGE